MFWLKGRKPDPVIGEIASALRDLKDAFEAPLAVTPEPEETSLGLVERLDSLENRFEELRGTCLRHLQSASQRLKLAERKEEEMELGDEGATNPLVPAPEYSVENAPSSQGYTDNLRWAADQLRARGEAPII